MKLAQIRDFLAVIESGSISATARKLGVSQPGLTKSLGALEAELGAALLKRTPTGVTLTRQGHAFHVRARAGYAELAKAQEELARDAKEQVAVGFGPFFAAQIVPQAVLRFREKCPDVELRLLEGLGHTTRSLVRDATLDMALAPRAPLVREDPAIRFKPIAHLDQIVVARRGHPLAEARSATALAHAEWLCVVRRDATAAMLRAICAPEPQRITECESFSAMLTLLEGSDMLAVVPHPFLDMPQVNEQVRQVPIAERLPGLTVGLHTRADAPLTRPAATLARLLSDLGRRLLQRT
jgi:LysR family transcriptional regulator, regulator of abg operon